MFLFLKELQLSFLFLSDCVTYISHLVFSCNYLILKVRNVNCEMFCVGMVGIQTSAGVLGPVYFCLKSRHNSV